MKQALKTNGASMVRCPSCARENLNSGQFCGECGTRLPGEAAVDTPENWAQPYTPSHLAREVLTSRFALEGERKLVTVISYDIANSTPFTARVGAEVMHGLLSRFFELALAEVHRFEGTINQFLGDGFMALFGAPIALEDHARRALLAATAILQRMQNAEGDARALREVGLRMGLNTGMVVVGKIGDNLRMDYTAIGDTTNLAARLQGIAEPGSIRTSESTYRAALPYFEFQTLGRFRLKGISNRVQVYKPLRARPTGQRGPADAPAVVASVFSGETPALERTVSYTPPHLVEKILTSRSALEGEHKLVTVMFCDIAGSTELAARMGAEAMHGVLNRFFELALAEVHRFEGTINNFLGGEVAAILQQEPHNVPLQRRKLGHQGHQIHGGWAFLLALADR